MMRPRKQALPGTGMAVHSSSTSLSRVTQPQLSFMLPICSDTPSRDW